MIYYSVLLLYNFLYFLVLPVYLACIMDSIWWNYRDMLDLLDTKLNAFVFSNHLNVVSTCKVLLFWYHGFYFWKNYTMSFRHILNMVLVWFFFFFWWQKKYHIQNWHLDTAGHYTLGNMLQMKIECLFSCSMCSDDLPTH